MIEIFSDEIREDIKTFRIGRKYYEKGLKT